MTAEGTGRTRVQKKIDREREIQRGRERERQGVSEKEGT